MGRAETILLRLLALAAAAVALGCKPMTEIEKVKTNPSAPTRTFRMGFSPVPPEGTTESVLKTIDEFTPRSDVVIDHTSIPWEALLTGHTAEEAVRSTKLDLAKLYRSRGMAIIVEIDPTNGLSRADEDPPLVALGHSIKEPAIQQIYRKYVTAMDTIIHPDYLGLASEVNLIRAQAPAPVYAALRQMVRDAYADARARKTTTKLYASIQADVAWGRLTGSGAYVGIATDLAEYPGMDVIGISSYPYLAGFAEPESVPLDYYARIGRDAALPIIVVEGGWTSANVAGFGSAITSTESKQARYIARQAAMLDSARGLAVVQLLYADPNPVVFGSPSGLGPFLNIGLVNRDFSAKQARSTWDSVFARPRK